MFAVSLTSERLNLHITSFSIAYVYAGMHIIRSMEVFNSRNGLIRHSIITIKKQSENYPQELEEFGQTIIECSTDEPSHNMDLIHQSVASDTPNDKQKSEAGCSYEDPYPGRLRRLFYLEQIIRNNIYFEMCCICDAPSRCFSCCHLCFNSCKLQSTDGMCCICGKQGNV